MAQNRSASRLRLAAVGERGFLRRFLPRIVRVGAGRFLVPPGDDAAVLRGPRPPVLTIDGLTENTHFRLRWDRRCRAVGGFSLARGLGWKLVGSSVSDLAAMGDSRNRWIMIYLGGPGRLSLSFLSDFFTGVRDAARRFDCALAGGDTVRAPQVTMVAAAGAVAAGRILRRNAARSGDAVCVAGTVGDAWAGLSVLEGAKKMNRKDGRFFVRRFFSAEARLKDGASLSRHAGVGALIDLSDGLAETVDLICQASGAGADIELSAVPISTPFRRRFGRPRALLETGEDYALLFTARPSALSALRRSLRFSVIGRIGPRQNGVRFFDGGRPIAPPRPFAHFS